MCLIHLENKNQSSMSETIDVSATEVYDDRSGWQAEDQIAVEYLEHVKSQLHLI